MDPILEVRPVRVDLFTYSLRAPGQPPRLVDDYFGTLEHCLRDAGEALNHYFERVELHLAGRFIGVVMVQTLCNPLQRRQVMDLIHTRLAGRMRASEIVPKRGPRARSAH